MINTELQKMLAGELYDASDPVLVEMRARARELLARFNGLMAAPLAERVLVLGELFGRCSSIDIQPPFFCDYGKHVLVGANCFMNFNCVILDCGWVRIGDNVQFGPAVQVYTAYHPLVAAVRIKGPELASPVTIGDNVWIGGGAIVCPGVEIGANTTIGAGSVVTRSIPEGVFAAGNPCRVVRSL
jgi:maltose O-acetyltransferase